jgi:hypothetical protein
MSLHTCKEDAAVAAESVLIADREGEGRNARNTWPGMAGCIRCEHDPHFPPTCQPDSPRPIAGFQFATSRSGLQGDGHTAPRHAPTSGPASGIVSRTRSLVLERERTGDTQNADRPSAPGRRRLPQECFTFSASSVPRSQRVSSPMECADCGRASRTTTACRKREELRRERTCHGRRSPHATEHPARPGPHVSVPPASTPAIHAVVDDCPSHEHRNSRKRSLACTGNRTASRARLPWATDQRIPPPAAMVHRADLVASPFDRSIDCPRCRRDGEPA